MVLSSNSLVGCLGAAKDLQIGGSPGSACTHALAYSLCDFFLAFPTDGANFGLLISQSH